MNLSQLTQADWRTMAAKRAGALTVQDLNRHIARKMAQDLAAADPTAFKPTAHTAPVAATHTPTPRLPRSAHQPGGPITMFEPSGIDELRTDLHEAVAEREQLAYKDGFYWGAICGICSACVVSIAAVLIHAWSMA